MQKKREKFFFCNPFSISIRFVVLAFRTNEWPFVINEIKRVLKDGGCFQCIEMDMRVRKRYNAIHTNLLHG